MFKKMILFSTIAFSINSYAATNSIECKIPGWNILNDQEINGTTVVNISDTDLKGQVSIKIDVLSKSGESIDQNQYADNIDLASATRIKLPDFRYFHLALVKVENKFKLQLTDDQTGDSHIVDSISCK